jgi:hypothetical protein
LFRDHLPNLATLTFDECLFLNQNDWEFLLALKRRQAISVIRFKQIILPKSAFYSLTALARSKKVGFKLVLKDVSFNNLGLFLDKKQQFIKPELGLLGDFFGGGGSRNSCTVKVILLT